MCVLVTYQISYISHLYSIVYDLGARAAVALLKHGLIHYDGRLNIFGRLAHIALIAPGPIGMNLINNASGQVLGAAR